MGLVFTKIRSRKVSDQFFVQPNVDNRSKSSYYYYLRKVRSVEKNSEGKSAVIDPTKDTLLKLCRSERWKEVESIAKSNPDAVFHHDPFSFETPLHLCCSLGAPLNTVDAVINAAPEVTTWTNSRQQLPIHSACFGAKNTEVIHKLLSINPNSALALDRSERTPLVCILSSPRCKNLPLKLLRHLVSKTPAHILRKSDKTGFLPIDHLCVWMVHHLKFPDEMTTDGPFLPRHHPSEGYILSALSILLKSAPDTSFLAFDQLLKLDCSSRSCASLYLRNTILRILFYSMNQYQRGDSPALGPNLYLIHHFVNFNLSQQSFYFVEGDDNKDTSITMEKATDARGELPLHILLRKPRNKNGQIILRRLIEIHPNAASSKDRFSNYPLHMSILQNMSFECIQKLLNSYNPAICEKYIAKSPSSVLANYNGFFPVFLAACMDSDTSVIYLLLVTFPSIIASR